MPTTTKHSPITAEGWEELPPNYCDNCWKRSTRANPVRFDEWSGRPLCRECNPKPRPTRER